MGRYHTGNCDCDVFNIFFLIYSINFNNIIKLYGMAFIFFGLFEITSMPVVHTWKWPTTQFILCAPRDWGHFLMERKNIRVNINCTVFLQLSYLMKMVISNIWGTAQENMQTSYYRTERRWYYLGSKVSAVRDPFDNNVG